MHLPGALILRGTLLGLGAAAPIGPVNVELARRTLLNPITVVFWFVAVPAALGAITKAPKGDLPMICVGVFIGTIAWVIGFAGAMAWAGRWRRGGWMALADAAGGAVLFCFGIAELWRVWRRLL